MCSDLTPDLDSVQLVFVFPTPSSESKLLDGLTVFIYHSVNWFYVVLQDHIRSFLSGMYSRHYENLYKDLGFPWNMYWIGKIQNTLRFRLIAVNQGNTMDIVLMFLL